MFEHIRKFGLEYHDLDTMLQNIAILLRLLALNIDGRYKKRIPIIVYILTLASLILYFYAFQVSMYWYILWRNKNETQFEKTVVFCLGTMSLMGVSKYIYMCFKRDELKRVVAAYLICDSQVLPNTRMSASIQRTLRIVKKRVLVYWTVMMGNLVMSFYVIPLLLPGRHLPDDNVVFWGLEPMFESPNYEIAFLTFMYCVPVVVLAPINLTSFLIVIVGYTEAQMTALSQELLSLWDDAQVFYEEKAVEINHTVHVTSYQRVLMNRFVKRRLETVMKAHATNKQLMKKVEDIYKHASAAGIVLLSITLISALLVGLENTYLLIPFSLVQVILDCLTGQRLLDVNTVFEDAVYECRWENFDVGNMKLVLVMLHNAQNTMKLSAGGIAWLSYSSLMDVIKSIYSTYAAFKN